VDLQNYCVLPVDGEGGGLVVGPVDIDFTATPGYGAVVPGFSTSARWALVRCGVFDTGANLNACIFRLTAPGGWLTEDLLLAPARYDPVRETGLRPLPLGWAGVLTVEPRGWGVRPALDTEAVLVWAQIRRLPDPPAGRGTADNSLGFY
jgi:hypothetical protein